MKKIFIPSLLVLGLEACSFSPEKLASEYCRCLADIENGKKKSEDCRSMSESHYLKLQDDENAVKQYTEKVLDCVTSGKIKTE